MKLFKGALYAVLAGLLLTVCTPQGRAFAQNVNCYLSQGGSTFTAGSSCTISVLSGGTISTASGATVTFASGTTVNVPFGGSTGYGTPLAGITDPTSTVSGTVQSTEYVLNSVTIPASAFNVNGRALRCEAWGATAANANAKNLKFYFGSTAIVTVTGSTASGKDYHAELNVQRTGASAQTGQALIQVDTATSPAMAQTTALTQTDTSAIVVSIKSANTAAAAASATGDGLSCYFIN